MLNASAVVGDWKCVCLILGWSLETVTLSAADLLNLKGKKKESLHVLAWSNIASIFLDFTYREISVELYLAMLSCLQPLFSSVQPFVPGNYVIMKKKALFDRLMALYILQCYLTYTNLQNLQLDPNLNNSQQ